MNNLITYIIIISYFLTNILTIRIYHQYPCNYLIISVSPKKVASDMSRKDVVQQTLVILPKFLHVLHFLSGLKTPQEVKPGCSF